MYLPKPAQIGRSRLSDTCRTCADGVHWAFFLPTWSVPCCHDRAVGPGTAATGPVQRRIVPRARAARGGAEQYRFGRWRWREEMHAAWMWKGHHRGRSAAAAACPAAGRCLVLKTPPCLRARRRWVERMVCAVLCTVRTLRCWRWKYRLWLDVTLAA